MLNTLRAVVEDDRIHWQEAVGDVVPAHRPVQVLVTVLEGQPHGRSLEEQARRRAAALQKLVALEAFSQMPDPAQWQREARAERELPGRGT